MNLAIEIVLIIVALLIGLVGGFYGARSYMKKYFKENPPISEDMIVAMMSQMGQKPSAKKVNQVMNMMKHQNN
ncbi:YneF family protein [Lactobacillus sp. ESL0679]|uniref:YneF family protein n=1 Tax=Lactobacillus sp. ESL0679 TaxID=2983209 RepID=UPI0023F632F2|nr:YneF family protein [Lactobacillus sp. ESL0679]MDF7683203.1 YneF family protein [Lactobacillus sp. ESL0679]